MHEQLTAAVTSGHDHRLVLLATSLCVFGAIAATRVLQFALSSTGSRRHIWTAAAALVGGVAIWATFLIATFAFNPGVAVSYAILPALMSLAAAIVMTGLAFAVFTRREAWAPILAGALLGYGFATADFLSLSSLQIAGHFAWDATALVMPLVYAFGFSVLAFLAIRGLPNDRGLLSGSVALVAGALTLHFTGTDALSVVADPAAHFVPSPVPNAIFAAAAAVVACFVFAIVLVCVVCDQYMAAGRAEAERRLHYMTYHDPLTGLPNRAFLNDALRARLEEAERVGGQVALLAVNLDRFKQINDIFGHQAGDNLLRSVASTIGGELRAGEILARVGGDEFLVVQSGVAQPEGAEHLARRLLDSLARDIDVEGTTLSTAASIGIALYPRDGETVTSLHPNADAALSRAKEELRGSYRFFEPEMDLQLRARRQLQMDMRDALKRDEFCLYYQPQAETLTGVISGFEALVRWEHPKRGLISPSDFVPEAEENGFIVELGEFVLRTACKEAASWAKPLAISVNLSPVQFQHGDLVETVRQVLRETGLDPERLELEITESVLIDDISRALDILKQLKGLGVLVAMDDFGTGYSSLAYLQAFPFDRIKIDRSFIAALHENKHSEAIIRAIVGLGRGLDVPVTAEGVETQAQQAFLAELDCAEIQGYLIGKPQPIGLLAPHLGGDEKKATKQVA
ncbi:bifunctional diguanylate cyclase/phosphodiesterase [Terrihabitans soli]|uniref:Bifunctional diguanylate cyclase/phosphodiesterase n=1 Tax=Terrihabitans soli TaxID=708113 RepID=A0A6S6QSH3_9HYPH|nr:EAL domain-containing protein [Terrihabitans soli]BCJ90222.1 bifunctional diguanylate cyclase/phosphodiesterase [Terrihabitans soli]